MEGLGEMGGLGGREGFGGKIRGVVWDWGDTLMRDIPGQAGPMVMWPSVEAMPGALAALQAFSSLGVQCVASNATESDGPMMAAALARVGLEGPLTRFFTSGELGVSKPDPAFFQRVAQELGIPPQALISIGNDLRKDILPAMAAGFSTIWVGGTDGASPEGKGPDLVVPDLLRLESLFSP